MLHLASHGRDNQPRSQQLCRALPGSLQDPPGPPHLSEMHSALSQQWSPPKPTAQVFLLCPKVSVEPHCLPIALVPSPFLALLSKSSEAISLCWEKSCLWRDRSAPGFSDPRALWQPPPHLLRCCPGIICPHEL